MKKKFINSEVIEGYVYQHKLEEKTVQNTSSANFGKEFINGSLFIATDEEGLNVVEVHYSYVTPTTKAEQPNKTYAALKAIMAGPTWVGNGKDAATKVKAQPSIAVNDFYDREGNLVTAKRNESGFISIVNSINPDEKQRATFTTDIVITTVKRIEADEEKHIAEDYDEIRGVVFNFRGDIIPVEFKIRNPEGMTYFEDLGASPAEPVFTKVWGKIVSETTRVTFEEKTAFGEPSVRTVERTTKEYLVTGASADIGEFDTEETITREELKKAQQNREIHLAEVKKNQDEYAASKNAGKDFGGAKAESAPVAIKKSTDNFVF